MQMLLRSRKARGARPAPRGWQTTAAASILSTAPSSPATLRRHDPRLSTRRWYAVDLAGLDKKWRQAWSESHGHGEHHHAASPGNGDGRKPSYVLPMFPYPSGALHLGHLRVYTIADAVARYHALKGDKVLLPMGWDAFGLPAENAALERGVAPDGWTESNIAKMKGQLNLMNGSWDWSRELTTCHPDFYKHTQKLFLMLHERGLAYQAEAEVNYDPVDKTVLANEQVDANGFSWRSGAKVERRKLKQWFFRISEFSEDLLEDLDVLAKDGAWPEHVLSQQKNWLGKSAGAMIKFPVMATGQEVGAAIEVFTTRPDTLFGVQYIALASTHPVVAELAKHDPELQAFLDTLPGLPPNSKVGYLLPQIRAINPLAYHADTPAAAKASLHVYVTPYILGDYGEGTVMGVPGHDLRDHSFWREHQAHQPVRVVLAASEDKSTTALINEPFVHHEYMTDQGGIFKGKPSKEAGEMIMRMLEAAGLARPVTKWRLRDWLISRQRYWGAPIPILHCDRCGAVPVPDDELPVLLPKVDNHWAQGKAGNALESSPAFVEAECPKCHAPARRDTDTMDTFVDSSWYFARFTDPHNAKQLLSSEAAKCLPVDIYIGGVEHAILHLLYARFIYKFLATTPLLPQYSEDEAPSAEPFKRLITQGMVHGKTYIDPETGKFLKPVEVDLTEPLKPRVAATGALATVAFEKMSKSKHNGVDPTEFISKYGADPTRAHMLFQAPVADVLNWDEPKISGVIRWLHRLYDHVAMLAASPEGPVPAMKYFATRTRPDVDPLKKMSPSDKEKALKWDADTALWRETQLKIDSVTRSYDKIYPLNVVVSDLMTLTNELIQHKRADEGIRRQTASTIVRLMAPITPAFSEECWSLLHPSRRGSIFKTAELPVQDGSLSMLQSEQINCAVQVNGKLRGTVTIPRPPNDVEGDALREWVVDAILDTDEGKNRFGEGQYDVRMAKRIIPVAGGRVINFVI